MNASGPSVGIDGTYPSWMESAARLGLRIAELPPSLSPATVMLLDPVIAREFSVVPLGRDSGGRLILAAASAKNAFSRLSELEYALGSVELVAGDPSAVLGLIARHYASDSVPVIDEAGHTGMRFSDGDVLSRNGVAAYVDEVIAYAMRVGAGDAHFEPFADAFHVRLRVDGEMRHLPSLPVSAGPAVVARLKVLSGLDIGLSRKAQDGRIRMRVGTTSSVDILVATLPTVTGECAVLRFLDSSRCGRSLDELGLPHATAEAILSVTKGHGLVLACGPTGSGKTTTLHAVLRSLDAVSLKILTVEDPVEYELPGAVQVHVRQKIGLGFVRVLRSFLRHDPDVIFVGEIRDAETASIALGAALTGHLVLASLHCSDAAEAPLRLVELGVAPWLVGSALELVIAQRLVRKICTGCSGGGCVACDGTGFFGRIAVFEHLRMTPYLSGLLDSGDISRYMDEAGKSLPFTMAQYGQSLVAMGLTTARELEKQVFFVSTAAV